jgi:hypothetical protein
MPSADLLVNSKQLIEETRLYYIIATLIINNNKVSFCAVDRHRKCFVKPAWSTGNMHATMLAIPEAVLLIFNSHRTLNTLESLTTEILE